MMDTQTTLSTLSDEMDGNVTDTESPLEQPAPPLDEDLLPFYFLAMAGSY